MNMKEGEKWEHINFYIRYLTHMHHKILFIHAVFWGLSMIVFNEMCLSFIWNRFSAQATHGQELQDLHHQLQKHHPLLCKSKERLKIAKNLVVHSSARTLKSLTGGVNNMNHPVTFPHYTGKTWVLAFMRMSCISSWQWGTPQWQGPSQAGLYTVPHNTEIAQEWPQIWQRAISVNLAYQFPRLHSNQASCRCLIRLGSGKFRGRANNLSSLSCSLGHSRVVFAVWKGTLSWWRTAAIRECCCNYWMYLYTYNGVRVGSVCQAASMLIPGCTWLLQDDQLHSLHLTVALLLWLIGAEVFYVAGGDSHFFYLYF